MEFQYFGGNCVKMVTKDASIVVDDVLESLGLKSVTKDGDITIATRFDMPVAESSQLSIKQPGEYEASKVAIQGIPVRAHMDEDGKQSATVFKLTSTELRVAVVGHIHPDLDEEQLESIGIVDVLIVPVGGNGYTLDAIGALKVIKKIEPKIVIPVHYNDPKLSYEVPQAELEDVLKNMAMEPAETTDKLKLKASDLPENTQLIILNRQ